MATTITLIRHAESQMNLTRDLVGGRSNHTPLSEHGRASALALGQRLAAMEPPAGFYCTAAVRSRQTADLIATGAGWAPADVEDGLLELSQGSAEGQPRDKWWTPKAIQAMQADPLHHRLIPDAENHHDVQQRMQTTLRRLARRHPDTHVIAISHGIAMRTLAWSPTNHTHQQGFQNKQLPNLGTLTFTVDNHSILTVVDPRKLDATYAA